MCFCECVRSIVCVCVCVQAERVSQQAWAAELCERERDLQHRENTLLQQQHSAHTEEDELLRRVHTLQQVQHHTHTQMCSCSLQCYLCKCYLDAKIQQMLGYALFDVLLLQCFLLNEMLSGNN